MVEGSRDFLAKRPLKFVVGGLICELVGVMLLIACSFVDPPFTSTDEGHATDVSWGPPKYLVYEIVVDESRSYFLSEPVEPAGPGPGVGQTVMVTYQDLTRRQSVLSITTSPGTSKAIIYVTPEDARYRARSEVAS